MKRWLWYAVLIGAVALLGGERSAGMDVAKLQPIQTVRVTCENSLVVIETDTGDMGAGDSIKDALSNMKETASAEIFLDTAEYLLVSENCEDLIPALMNYLRPSCCLCFETGEGKLETVGAFLEIHDPKATLKDYRAGEREIPTLVTEEGRMELVR